MAYDIAIINIKGHTLDDQNKLIEAIGINDNLITKVGSTEDINQGIDDNTLVIDGENRVLLPGFCDSHTHFATYGIMNTKYINLVGTRSREEILNRLQQEAQAKEPGEWIAGINWDESKWTGSKKIITKEELDEIAPVNPVSIQRVDGHVVIVNSKALAELKIDPSIKGFEIVDGVPTGRLLEEARFVLREKTEADVKAYKEGLTEAIKEAHQLGVTAIHDVYADPERFKAYQEMWQEKKLNLRTTLYMSDKLLDQIIEMGFNLTLGDEYLRIAGLKIFSDGSIGAKSAWVKNGYSDDPDNKGIPIWEPEELTALIKKAHQNDIQITVHAIGDQAVTETINGFQAAQNETRKELKHRIEHLEMVTKEQLETIKELGLTVSMQPNFIGEWGHPGGMYEENFDAETIKTMDPFKWINEIGVDLLLGSDCMPFDPFYGIHSVVNAPFECQRLSVEDAIKGYTTGTSFATYSEKKAGIIKEGYLADLILLDGDPFAEPTKIKDMRPIITIFDGKVVYQKD